MYPRTIRGFRPWKIRTNVQIALNYQIHSYFDH